MSFFKGRFILFYTITGEFDKMRILLSDCVRNTSLIYVLFSDYRSLRFCATASVVALFFMEEKQNGRTIGIILQGFLSTNEIYNKKIRRKIIMYRKEKSSWKPPFGLTVFVVVITLTALISIFAFLKIDEEYVKWGLTDLARNTPDGWFYNYIPIIIAFGASFLPFLTFSISKRMRGHQRLLAFTLFLVTAMIFCVCQEFKIWRISAVISGQNYIGCTLEWGQFWRMPITLSQSYVGHSTTLNLFAVLQLVGKYALCFLPLLAFPMANAIHKKNQGSKTVTIMILLFILICWAVNLYFLNYDDHSLYWARIKAFDFENISFDSGMFFFLGITLASVLPLLGLGIGKAPKKVENHYEVTKIIYCPIERNDRD